MLYAARERRRPNVRYVRVDPRRSLSANQALVRLRYRFNDAQLDWITEKLAPMLGDDLLEPWAISKRLQVAMGIRYLCTNSHQIVVGDTLGCSQKTVSNIVGRVIEALNNPELVRQFIVFKPQCPEWCRRRANEFARIGKFISESWILT
ncbi:hypothetical protein Y032_0435g1407 [Ancylostoma ceylanicum]|nr:hypothetical protein Y032_0435g1407 [Ancylostoma ceylanicum]